MGFVIKKRVVKWISALYDRRFGVGFKGKCDRKVGYYVGIRRKRYWEHLGLYKMCFTPISDRLFIMQYDFLFIPYEIRDQFIAM